MPHDPISASRPARARTPDRASTLQLVFMTYTVICGGAYGLEEMVSGAGPGLALLILVVLPVIYAAPLALTCAELAARFPVEGGYYRWVRMAFGPRVGYTIGWLMWLAMFATNASFAVLFANYLRSIVPTLSPTAHFAAAVAVVWGAVLLNYRGIRIVATASIIFTVVVVVPFIIMSVMGLAQWQFNPLLPFANPDVPLATATTSGLLIALWLYGGFEKLTVNAGEVQQPSRAFPLALAIGVPLCAASYVVPTFAALAANGDWSSWGESHFMVAATRIGGSWLAFAMVTGALVSNAGIITVTMLSQSRVPAILAADGLFPRIFAARHPRFGTPVVSLIVTGLVLTPLCALRFAQLAGGVALVQSLAYLLIYAALFKLRRTAVSGDRPVFQLPFGTVGLLLMAAPSVALVSLVVVQGLFNDGQLDPRQVLVDLVLVGSGPITFGLSRRWTTRSMAADRPRQSGFSA